MAKLPSLETLHVASSVLAAPTYPSLGTVSLRREHRSDLLIDLKIFMSVTSVNYQLPIHTVHLRTVPLPGLKGQRFLAEYF
jgi:hypothetical protein